MNSKLNFIGVLTVFLIGIFLFSTNDGSSPSGGQLAESILPERVIHVTGSVLSALQEDDWTLADKIEEGKELLENSPALQFEQSGSRILRKELTLAILDTKTGVVFEKRYWLNESDINEANSIRRNYEENHNNLPRFRSNDPEEEYTVITNWWNNFNSDWSIARDGVNDGRYVVVANKFLMENDSLAYPEDRTGTKYSDIVYVPYSDALKDKSIVEAGKKFMNEHVQAAFKSLTDAKVESRAFPGQLVTDTITETFVKNIFLTEQTDPRMMLLSKDGGQELVNRVLIRLGTNGEKAFRYTVSKTGASGLGQIMPGTYDSIVRAYPSANLVKDTDIGRVDITNAIKASTLVFDDHLAVVVTRANRTTSSKRIFDQKTESEIDEIRAAIYNGGASKYQYLTGTISTAVTETVLFLRKFRMIRELDVFS